MERELTIPRIVSEERSLAPRSPAAPLRGVVLALIQFDVCEEIRLDVLRQILGARVASAGFKHQVPGYVQYQRPPVEEAIEPVVLEPGERLQGTIQYFDYGVVSVAFEVPFAGDWDSLVQLSSRWVSETNFEALAAQIVRQKLDRAAPALVKPYTKDPWLQEDYFIFHVREIEGAPTASELLGTSGGCIAQVVRGETAHSTPIVLGREFQDGIEVRTGLSGGETVIVAPANAPRW
jgi:hypothetical protein